MSNFTGRAVGGRPGGNRFGGNRDRGGKPPFGKKPWGGGNRGGGFDRSDRGPVTMHAATCANCGKACEVPFKPSGDKPVYCKDCFGGKGSHSNDGGFHKKSRSFDGAPVWKGNDRPSFVSTSSNQKSEGSGMATKQLEMVNAKLEVLISAVEKLTTAMTKKSEVTEVVAQAVEKSAKKKLTRKTK
jgi:CxxC-x17-CxxC domain-containing protein